jgi:hypothetical protein
MFFSIYVSLLILTAIRIVSTLCRLELLFRNWGTCPLDGHEEGWGGDIMRQGFSFVVRALVVKIGCSLRRLE